MSVLRWIIALYLMAPVLASAEPRTNLLLIVTDNQSASLLGAYGNSVIRTPNIDQLAEQGIRFDNAYAASGVCSSSRAVMLTGLMPSQNGVHNGLPGTYKVPDWSAIEEYRNLPQTLADAGYRTGMVGKYHLGAYEKAQLGFDFWVTFKAGHTTSFVDLEVVDNGEFYNIADRGEHVTDFWTRRAVSFLAEQQEDQPFFLMVSYNGPYILPPTVTQPPTNDYADYYLENTPAMPQEALHPYLRDWARAARIPSYVGESLPWSAIGALNNRKAIANVAAETTLVDEGIGRLLAELKRQGLDENTLVVFLSDQGSAYGQLGLWGNSSWGTPAPAYNANMQIPLIFTHPGKIPGSQTSDLMINQYDLLPTLLDYLGLGNLEIANSPGASFAPALVGDPVDWDNTVFFEYITTRVVQTRRWKYTKRILATPNELYDLESDPEERINLIADPEYRSVLAEMDDRLEAFFGQYTYPRYDIWKGGTAKATLSYGNRNKRFSEHFENWEAPVVEKGVAFRD